MVNPGIVKAIAAAGAPPKGVKFMATWMHTLDTPGSKDFVKAYKEKWGEPPPHLAASAYRNVQIILEVLRRTGGGTSSREIAKALSNISLETIEGRITFTRDQTPIRNMFAGEFTEVKGEWVPKHLKTYRVVSEKVGDKLVPKLAK
jgi:branched-chain amino acid transport system substrate-binding protein